MKRNNTNRGKTQVLIFDDQIGEGDPRISFLEKFNSLQVKYAGTTGQAIKVIDELPASFKGIILVDLLWLNSPQFNGINLIKRIRENGRKGLKIIAFSQQPALLGEAIEAGANCAMPKDDSESLQNVVLGLVQVQRTDFRSIFLLLWIVFLLLLGLSTLSVLLLRNANVASDQIAPIFLVILLMFFAIAILALFINGQITESNLIKIVVEALKGKRN